MQLGTPIAEGKTKIVYIHPDDPQLAVIQHKDGITAGDGARRNVIVGKGELSGRTTANVFALLAKAGIRTHFVAAPAADQMIVQRCQMIPLEVVMRRLATGSYLKRNPEVSEGTRFDPPLVEFFLKDDANHDPLVTPAQIVAQGVASMGDIELMRSLGQQVFDAIEQAWATLDVTLVDLKIEFGRTVAGDLIVADVIDNDSWRIWPGGDKSRMLDKQVYRNMQEVTEDGLATIRQRYALVADLTETWR
ncbi:MAG: phosphoribosylaminoimidazolesuccinocarboxamide synthase [Roseiflexaceae bacterium]